MSFDNLVTYYSDFESDQVIHEFHNPFTGSRNTVKPYVSRMKEGREISPRGVVKTQRRAAPSVARTSKGNFTDWLPRER